MQAANRLRTALQTGKGVSFGAWQMLPGANHSRIMAKSGFDWICVDTEHGNIADGQMHEAVAAIAATEGFTYHPDRTQMVEEIAKVPGVDVLLVGPWDLGNNISRPVMGDFHPDLVAAIERIRKAAVDNGKKAGIYSADGDSASKYAEQGFHMSFASVIGCGKDSLNVQNSFAMVFFAVSHREQWTRVKR
ncbi:hypothetical protein HCAG_01834 [Histoplasma mississippiense (nom. inval.)]|uniref:hypothetical protein n=1 Tax=Ajellomyces capsulatus (strain NAm1 / WU24) TaxID=2059318 RepID=UPI000157B8CA|nr:hypothetical protein HCAG_01834 [Histoplasma mississippiense (nom. inval.)]EDN03969.1 hypothetical protein HCAG_01834 [Histoplasma mississippiense (nom. inval.)]